MLNSSPEVLLTTAEMAEADRLTIAGGTAGALLMEQAGAAVARETARQLGRPGRAVVLCGPGNNGGDGFAAARLLSGQGFSVEAGLLGARDGLRGDAALAANAWRGGILGASELALESADAVIDALFGAGLARDLDGEAKDLVIKINAWSQQTGKPVIAVDVPSGIDGTTGKIRGAAVMASRTVTFFRRKPGHVLLPGRRYCGQTVLAQIGIPESVLEDIAPVTYVNSPELWRRVFPVPQVEGHKYSRGHALVLSGGLAHTGAARLAARGALRAGAGLVTVATPRDALCAHAAALTAVMTRVCEDEAGLAGLLADRRKNALVMGPALGVGEETRALVRTALGAESGSTEPRRAIVLDADALTSFEGEPQALAALIRQSQSHAVLTPHDGEFARLFGQAGQESKTAWAGLFPAAFDVARHLEEVHSESKLVRARAAAALTGAVVILKGPDTIVAEPSGRAAIAEDLPPWLATAGSGDVLAGITGGLLAQSMPPFEAACAAVWLHGAAARHFGPGLIAEDIPESLPRVLRALIEDGIVA
jgi:hydroxyethylthiazole kinase-like uncharacterized protein yjeF